MIQLEHVSKYIISDMNLNIPQGTAVGLLGRSGAGKTTVLKLCCGLLKPMKGRVRTIQQDPVKYRRKYGRELGVFFTGIPILDDRDSVKGGLELISYVYGMKREEFMKEYDCLVDCLEFGNYEQEKVGSLSLGQRMRVELAATLLYRPQLLLLDEPTLGLDQVSKLSLRELLQERVREGMTLFVSSHDMNEISHLCDRLAILDQGKLEFYGDQETLRLNYQTRDCMELKLIGKLPDLGDVPFVKYSIENERLILTYPSNYITSAELLQIIMSQTTIEEIKMKKSDLGSVLLQYKDN